MMLYTRYESSETCSSRQEDFWKLHFENILFLNRDLLMQPMNSSTTVNHDHL